MKNIVGIPAVGDNFFRRDREIEKILERINADNNLQIAAPRRVGKTSILNYLKDKEAGGHLYVYVDTEDVENEQDFYKTVLKAILKVERINKSGVFSRLIRNGEKLFRKVKSIKVLGNGIEFNEDHEGTDYYEEIVYLFGGLEIEGNQKVILLIDEFPQTILNIIQASGGETKTAIHFLQTNRHLRQLPELLGRVQFVYTGSIGLNHTVEVIGASAFVNDLNTIEIEPLTIEEAQKMVRELVREKSFAIDQSAESYLLEKIKWLIPFHIQLAIHELTSCCRDKKKAGNDEIDQAFTSMVASRNNGHFNHYHSRLKSQLKDKKFHYAETVLDKAAKTGSISQAELYDLAQANEIPNDYRPVIELLIYDGYINNNKDNKYYQFNSPVLRMWWEKHICK